MIKYLGSKRTLLPSIIEIIRKQKNVRRVLDVFSGTSRVGHALKKAGYEVHANDHNTYAYTLAKCYIQADRQKLLGKASKLLTELEQVPTAKEAGWFTNTYCEEARFFRPENGRKIEAIREHIEELDLSEELRAIALVSLMEAADRVDSTTGVQMAYLKQWATRAFQPLELRLPDILDGFGMAYQMDALDFVANMEADLAYLDPPYNQHSYLGNYHIWETLIRWDKPEV